ncbi:hypothetical protein BJV77DRAFT_1025940 [Russula vinacea]|nr:hypothetical protein BJV77DRAFT_1025940 [Russula vinacea]
MPLEATMIVLDNSEYMRNGDYQPTRFGALADAVTTVFQTKIDSNPENTVGVMTMANKGRAQHLDNLGRTASIPTAIAIAQLALKHRQNKNLRQRVIVFVGSPLDDASPDSERALIRLAKKLKKNNVALDVEAAEEGGSILRAFVENASSSDNSHYLAVPPGPHLLSSMILNSPILAGDRGIPDELADAVPGGVGGSGAAGGAGGGAGTSQFEFGVDPTLDPELAMVRFVSPSSCQRATTTATGCSSSSSSRTGTGTAVAVAGPGGASVQQQQQHQPSGAAAVAVAAAPPTDEGEEALLQQALALSEARAEEEMIARAIEMSMHPEPESEEKK